MTNATSRMKVHKVELNSKYVKSDFYNIADFERFSEEVIKNPNAKTTGYCTCATADREYAYEPANRVRVHHD